MIKYLGSKRLLAPALGAAGAAIGARTALDVFTGTTRVAQALKAAGANVTTLDIATYSEVLARTYIETDASRVDAAEVDEALRHLNSLPGRRGYFTRTFCEASRYVQPENGRRVDAIRDEIEASYRAEPMRSILLTALLLATDRVDSTTGLQMAYLKSWSARSHQALELRAPVLLPGVGRALLGDAGTVVPGLAPVDLAYLDPPYNQHRYFTNYHVWETLVRWDEPEHYGIACKRADARDAETKSPWNSKRRMPTQFRELIGSVRAETVIVSYNDEAWVQAPEIGRWLLDAGHEALEVLAVDSRRYIGARIGIFSRTGERVGTPNRLRNTEYLFVAGPRSRVDAAAQAIVDEVGGRTQVEREAVGQ